MENNIKAILEKLKIRSILEEQKKNLPETYRGYLVEDLIELCKVRKAGRAMEGVPKDMIGAEDEFSYEYNLW